MNRAQRTIQWASLHSSNKSVQNWLQPIRRTQIKISNRTITISTQTRSGKARAKDSCPMEVDAMSAAVKGTSPVTARRLLDRTARRLVTHVTAATERVTRRQFAPQPILSLKVEAKAKEDGSRTAGKGGGDGQKGSWQQKGGKAKGGGNAKGWGKGKGNGLYDLDLWGGSENGGGDWSEWDNSSYYSGIR